MTNLKIFNISFKEATDLKDMVRTFLQKSPRMVIGDWHYLRNVTNVELSSNHILLLVVLVEVLILTISKQS